MAGCKQAYCCHVKTKSHIAAMCKAPRAGVHTSSYAYQGQSAARRGSHELIRISRPKRRTQGFTQTHTHIKAKAPHAGVHTDSQARAHAPPPPYTQAAPLPYLTRAPPPRPHTTPTPPPPTHTHTRAHQVTQPGVLNSRPNRSSRIFPRPYRANRVEPCMDPRANMRQ